MSLKMDVAMLLSNGFGPDPRVLKEANSLCGAGYEVTILAWDRQKEFPPQEQLSSGARILRIQEVPSGYGIGTRQLAKLPQFWVTAIRLMDQLDPRVIHCHDFDTLPAGLFWAKKNHRPVVYDVHDYYADLIRPRVTGIKGKLIVQMIRSFEKYCSTLASAIITVDETGQDIYQQLNARVVILGHYPDIGMFTQTAPVFMKNELTMVYAGRLSSDRGILTYLEILRELRRREIPARLILAGNFTPKSERQALEKSMLGLEDFVDIRGWIEYDKIPDFLASADIGLVILAPLPRFVVAVPIKFYEYMAVGLPVIANAFPFVARVAEEVNCGFLVREKTDVSAIADTIIQWWQHPEIPKALGANGRKAILEKYHWDVQFADILKLYVELLN